MIQTSKKPYFHCGHPSRTSSKSREKKRDAMKILRPSFTSCFEILSSQKSPYSNDQLEKKTTQNYDKFIFIFVELSPCVFPFLGRKSLEIKKRLQSAIVRTLPYCKSKDISKAIFKSPSKIVNHFHIKDTLPKKLCSGIVYSFKCNSCNAIYYGKTKRHFYVRAADHMGISRLTNKCLKNVK